MPGKKFKTVGNSTTKKGHSLFERNFPFPIFFSYARDDKAVYKIVLKYHYNYLHFTETIQ